MDFDNIKNDGIQLRNKKTTYWQTVPWFELSNFENVAAFWNRMCLSSDAPFNVDKSTKNKILDICFVVFEEEVSCSSKVHPDFEIHPSTTLLIFGLQQSNNSECDSSEDEDDSNDDENNGGGDDIEYQGRRTAKNKRQRLNDPQEEDRKPDIHSDVQSSSRVLEDPSRKSF